MYISKILVIFITALLTLTEIVTSTPGLECWACSSLVNSICADDDFFRTSDANILKKNCGELPRLEGHRNMKATTCTKTVIQDQRLTIVNRGCGFPNEVGQIPMAPYCSSQTHGHGYGVHVHYCQCMESYCNGSESLLQTTKATRTTIFILVTLTAMCQRYLL